MTGPIQMLRFGVDLRRAEGKGKPLEYLAKNTSQVLLVRMIEGNRLDHVICVDSSRRLILDSAEPCALRLSEEALKALGTLNGREVRIAEVRELYKCRE